MEDVNTKRWLEWAREIQAISQTGYHYALNDFERERNHRLSEIASEIVSEYANLDRATLIRIFESQSGYATPRVDVRGAVFLDEKLLLVREIADGGWTLPGGWADVGESPSVAVQREVWEEAGFHVKASKVVGIYDANRISPMELFHAFKIVFLCDLMGGEAKISNETSEVAFFNETDFPTTFSGERTQLRHLQDALRAKANPDYPTVFD